MEVLSPQSHRQHLAQSSPNSMNWSSLTSKVKLITLRSPVRFRPLCTVSVQLSGIHELAEAPIERRKSSSRSNSRARVKVTDVQLKENWLSSLSCPSPAKLGNLDGDEEISASVSGSDWMIGVDPDVSGALALLKTDQSGCSAQVFDSPHVQVLVGKNRRRRLDPKSIVQLLRSLDAPSGTTAYIEQSTPFPADGKQGWWGGGFGYGLWIGILVASGFSVVPVSSALWKNEFELSGSRSSKDSSRDLASELFPALSPMLKRKKDHVWRDRLYYRRMYRSVRTISQLHSRNGIDTAEVGAREIDHNWLLVGAFFSGRAEALLIAAYGRRCKTKADEAGLQAESMS